MRCAASVQRIVFLGGYNPYSLNPSLGVPALGAIPLFDSAGYTGLSSRKCRLRRVEKIDTAVRVYPIPIPYTIEVVFIFPTEK